MALPSLEQVDAFMFMGWHTEPDGSVVATVFNKPPGLPREDRSFSASVGCWDELSALAHDFHNEWRSWGSAIEAPLYDLLAEQHTLF